MARKTFKVVIDGQSLVAWRGIPDSEDQSDPQLVTCPICRQFKRQRKPIADCTQYGFAWDAHTTIFKCACGAQFFHEYRIWAEESEATS